VEALLFFFLGAVSSIFLCKHAIIKTNSIKKLLDIINTLGKVAGYKINIQKSVDFKYTNNEQSKKKFKKPTSFTIASKNT
jgi:hypothetical protein